jgi:hypothetical protein
LSVAKHEVYEPTLERNEVLDTAFTGLEGFLVVNDFKGHHEPQRIRFIPELTREEHERLSTTPLPKRLQPSPFAGARANRNVSPGSAPRTAPVTGPSPDAQKRRANLAALLQRLKDAEDWQAN